MTNTNNEAVAAEKAAVVKDIKNNVARPGAGTATGKVWEICDVLYARATPENPITRASVIKAAEAEGVNVSTAATQYGRWRTYMSLGRETAVAVKGEGEAAPKKTRAKKANAAEAAEAAAPVIEGDEGVATTADAEAPVAAETHPAFADEAGEDGEAQA